MTISVFFSPLKIISIGFPILFPGTSDPFKREREREKAPNVFVFLLLFRLLFRLLFCSVDVSVTVYDWFSCCFGCWFCCSCCSVSLAVYGCFGCCSEAVSQYSRSASVLRQFLNAGVAYFVEVFECSRSASGLIQFLLMLAQRSNAVS